MCAGKMECIDETNICMLLTLKYSLVISDVTKIYMQNKSNIMVPESDLFYFFVIKPKLIIKT